MDDSNHSTSWSQELSTGQTAIVAVGEDQRSVTFSLVCPKGISSVVPVRERLEQLCPFVMIACRKAAKVIGMDVAYSFTLGNQLRCHVVDCFGRVKVIPAKFYDLDCPLATRIGPI